MNNKKNWLIFLLIILLLFNLAKVDAFELTAQELTKDICPSSTIVFTATVSGTGNFNAYLEGTASKFSTVVPQSLSLNNEAKTIFIYVTPSINVNPGKYSLNLIVGSGSDVKNINYEVDVTSCFNIEITGPSSKELCSCNTEYYEFNIVNKGIYQDTYQIDVTGQAASWVTLSQNKIVLDAGKSSKIIATLAAPCNTKGENDFNIVIRSLTTNTVASFASSALVNSCFEFDAKLSKDFINFCEHSIENVPIIINNLADQENEFNLKITGPAWANLEINNLKLDSNSKKDVNLILNPDYGVQGDFNINVNVQGIQGKINKDLTLKATVRKCHDVLLEILETQDKVCSNVAKSYQVNVKNLGEFEKEFKLESSEAWAKLSQDTIKLDKNSAGNISLDVNANNISAGSYKVNLKATALDTSKVTSQDSINLEIVNSKDCYKASLSSINTELNADATATVPITITNNGIETATYLLGISGSASSFVRLNPASLTLKPGKSEVVYLYVAPPFNTIPDTYKADVFAKLADSGILANSLIEVKVKTPSKMVEEKEVKETFLDKLYNRIKNWFKSINLGAQQNLTTPVTKVNETKEELRLINLDNETLIHESVKFSFKGEHTIKVVQVNIKDVVLEIKSNPTYIILDLDETEQVDLNDDGVPDLNLTLKSIKNKTPEIEINKLEQKTEENLLVKQVKENISKYKYWIISIVIVILILILLFTTNAFKKMVNFFKEDVEEGEEQLKIGRYILLIIILIVIIWL